MQHHTFVLAGSSSRRCPSARKSREFKLELLCAVLSRRRQAGALAAAQHMQGGQGPPGPKMMPHWSGFVWADHVARLTESEFKLRYRLTADAFYDLVEILRPDLTACNERLARNAKWGHLISVETKLAIGLRFMAGGEPLDLKLIYDVDKSYIYTCIWLVVDAVNARLKVEFPLLDVDKLSVLESEFRAASRKGVWAGQVGAADGVHFPMIAPTKDEVPDPLREVSCYIYYQQ